jgi:hypothetical protein
MSALKPILLAALLAASPALAQDRAGKQPPKEPPQPSAPAVPQMPRPDVGPIVTVDFPGGTVGQYIDSIRRASSNSANIVLPPRAAKVTMPAVSLKGVTLLDALNAIVAVADIPTDEDWMVRPLATLGMGGVAMYPGESMPGFALLTQSRMGRGVPGVLPGGPTALPVSARTEVFSVRDLLDSGLKPDAVLTSLDTAMRMDQRAEAPDVKFHEESGLLILRASAEQLDAARQVVLRLQEASKSAARVRAAEQRHAQMQQLTSEIDDLYRQWEGIKSEYYALKDAANYAQAEASRVPGPNDSPESMGKARARAAEAQKAAVSASFQVDHVERDLRRREHMLEQLRSMDQGGGGGGADEIARLRAENAELRSRLEKLEEKKGR